MTYRIRDSPAKRGLGTKECSRAATEFLGKMRVVVESFDAPSDLLRNIIDYAGMPPEAPTDRTTSKRYERERLVSIVERSERRGHILRRFAAARAVTQQYKAMRAEEGGPQARTKATYPTIRKVTEEMYSVLADASRKENLGSFRKYVSECGRVSKLLDTLSTQSDADNAAMSNGIWILLGISNRTGSNGRSAGWTQWREATDHQADLLAYCMRIHGDKSTIWLLCRACEGMLDDIVDLVSTTVPRAWRQILLRI